MRLLEFTVPSECDGITVRDFARNKLGLSARVLTKQKQHENGILKNGAPCRTVDILRGGDVLAFNLPNETVEYQAVKMPLDILFESDDYLAVYKPPHMPIHPSPGHDCDSLLNACAYYFQQSRQSCLFRPMYRLDKDTSGIVVICKHRVAAAAKIEKRYFAVCQGELTGSGTIDLPIGLRGDSKIVRECGHGDIAVTYWRAVVSHGGHTLLSVQLETGRTHQIRAHMSHNGWPLAGDDLYGGSTGIIGRQALHCGFVNISCGLLSTDEQIISEFPEDMRQTFSWLPTVGEIIREEMKCRLV